MSMKRVLAFVVTLMLSSVFGITVFAESSYKDSEITVFDKDNTWSDSTTFDLFERNEFGNQLMYPGVNGYYSFTVRNRSVKDRECEVVIEDINDCDIPLDIRIKCNDTYILGTEDSWVTSADYDSGVYLISANSDDVYELEWKWDYYVSDEKDVVDTTLGKNARIMPEKYILNIKAYGEADLIEISKPDPDPSDPSSEPSPEPSPLEESSDLSIDDSRPENSPPTDGDKPTTGDTSMKIVYIFGLMVGVSAGVTVLFGRNNKSN